MGVKGSNGPPQIKHGEEEEEEAEAAERVRSKRI